MRALILACAVQAALLAEMEDEAKKAENSEKWAAELAAVKERQAAEKAAAERIERAAEMDATERPTTGQEPPQMDTGPSVGNW